MERKKRESLPNILQYSTVIKQRWKTLDKLGQGAFGEIYAGIDLRSRDDVAVKVERSDCKKMVLKLEVIALKKLQKSRHVVRYIHSGRQEHFNYLIMERLGENLATLFKRTQSGFFSLCTTVQLSIQILDCLEGIHNLGYIHRDVKPSNFCLFRVKEKKSQVCLIDFNLARRYILSTGGIRPPRKHAGFRGTARYASVCSHHAKELSRRDDLWSVFYIMVEFATGQLPWKRLKDKKHIGELKERFTNAELVKDLPPEFLLFMQHLISLKYEDKPDYNYLRSILYRIFTREGYPSDFQFDWELPQEESGESEDEESIEQSQESEDSQESTKKSQLSRNRKEKKDSSFESSYKYKVRSPSSGSSRVSNKKKLDQNVHVEEKSGKANNSLFESSSDDKKGVGYHVSPSKNQKSPRSQKKEHQYIAKYFSPSPQKSQKCCVIL